MTHLNFDFARTVSFLQRGALDPVNSISTNSWRRACVIDSQPVLLEVSEPFQVHVLQGNTTDERAHALAKRCLGFQDAQATLSAKIPKLVRQKIKDSLQILTPQYPSLFEALVQTILGQQISVSAANKVRARFVRHFNQSLYYKEQVYFLFPDSDSVAACSAIELQNIGMSQVKAKAITGIAQAICSGKISEEKLQPLSNEKALAELTQFYGIGLWSAEWALLRGLARYDLVPASDLVVRKAFSWIYDRDEIFSITEVREKAQSWGQHRGSLVYKTLCAFSLALKNRKKEEK